MKTWTDIEAAAQTDPVLYQLVMLVRYGYLTREDALIATVLGLAEIARQQRARLLDLINTRGPAPVFIPSEVLRKP